jgi:hypothetical protein
MSNAYCLFDYYLKSFYKRAYMPFADIKILFNYLFFMRSLNKCSTFYSLRSAISFGIYFIGFYYFL